MLCRTAPACAPRSVVSLAKRSFVLLKRRRDLTSQEASVLESWTSAFPLLAQAYEAKEATLSGSCPIVKPQRRRTVYGGGTCPANLNQRFET